MAIPDYVFYKDVFLGAEILEEDWDRLAARADERLAQLERAYTVTDPTGCGREKTVCAIAEKIGDAENGDVNVSIGSVSTSRKAAELTDTGVARIAQTYLGVYRGVPHGCLP